MDEYGPSDTPSFEYDCFLGDGVTTVTPLTATCQVWNLKTGVQVAGTVTPSISTNKVIVVVPNSMVTVGPFRASLTIQLDASTFKTVFYEYVVVSVNEAS